MKLTKAQREALQFMSDRGGRGHSGRNATASLATMQALHKKELVRPGRKWTHEQDWHLTDAGRTALTKATS